jgi:hypothetical protein
MSEVPGYIKQAGQAAAEAQGVAGNTAAGQYTIGDIITKKLTEAYAYNKDIISQLDQSTSDYFSAPSEARVKYQDIFNPFQRENLTSQYVGNKALPMLSQANVLGARMGGVADIARSGVAGYQAKSARETAKANAAQTNYENLLGEFQLEQQLNAVSTQELEINGRRVLATLDRNGNIVKQVDLGPAKKTGTGAPYTIEQLKGLFGIENETNEEIDTGSKYWEDVVTFQDLNDSQKKEALQRSVNSDKSVDEIAREIIEGQNNPKVSGGTYGATGTPAADVNYGGLQYTGFKL